MRKVEGKKENIDHISIELAQIRDKPMQLR